MLWKRGIVNQKAQISINTADTSRRIAFEKSRVKPEDASPLAARHTFRDAVAAFGKRILRFFSGFLGFGRVESARAPIPKNITKGKRGRRYAIKVTPPRGFGSSRAGTKIGHRIANYT